MPDPKPVDKNPVDQIHYRKNSEHIEKPGKKAGSTVYGIGKNKDISKISGDTKAFENYLITFYFFGSGKSSLDASFLNVFMIQKDHSDSPFA